MREGGCLCGKVRYKISGAPIIVAHCFCRDCQRVSGAGHTTGAMFPSDAVEIAGRLSEFQNVADSGSTVTHLFCATCSSRLFGKNTGMPGVMTVSAGSLDEPDDLEPMVAVFGRTRPHWDPIAPEVQAFDAQPAWKPEQGA